MATLVATAATMGDRHPVDKRAMQQLLMATSGRLPLVLRLCSRCVLFQHKRFNASRS